MTLSVNVNGGLIGNPISIDVSRALDEISGSFSFALENKGGLVVGRNPATGRLITSTPLPILTPLAGTLTIVPQIGNTVQIFADGKTWLTGFIENIDITYDKGTHNVVYSGRSKTGDLIDTTLDSTQIEFKTPISLKNLTIKILESVGLADRIKVVINAFTFIDDFKAGELIAGEVGQSVAEFLMEYAVKRQLLMGTDGSGNLVYSDKRSYVDSAFTLENKVGLAGNNRFNNIESSHSTYDVSRRFRDYRCRSQTGVQQVKKVTAGSPAEITDSDGTAQDIQIREGRTLVFIAETTSDNIACTKRAEWTANRRRAESFKYSALVEGHSIVKATGTGRLVWEPGSFVTVDDVYVTPLTRLLINSVHMRYHNTGGSHSEIGCITPDAYSLDASELQTVKDTRQQGAETFIPDLPPTPVVTLDIDVEDLPVGPS